MKYLSVCSGIEAATVAWHPLGFTPVAFSEIDPFASAVLRHRYPNVPNLGDMTRFKEWVDVPAFDLLVGGTPCQSFSVAGLRKGLDDPRGHLTLTYLAIADRYRPEWLVWENVPGVLSADKGRAFGSFLGGLGELGYGFAYRVLDAQYFGLAQRRQRVFVVANLRDWRRAAAVLFERESLQRDPSPRRKAQEGVAGTLTSGAARRRGAGEEPERLTPTTSGTLGGASQTGGFRTTDLDNSGAFIPEIVPQAMSAKWSKGSSGPAGDEVANMIAVPDVAPTLRAGGNETGGHRPPGTDVDTSDSLIPVRNVAATIGQRMRGQDDACADNLQVMAVRTANTSANGHGISDDAAHTLDSAMGQAIAFGSRDSGQDALEDLSPTLRAGASDKAHPNGGCGPAIAFEARYARNGRGAPEEEVVPPLKAQSGSSGKGDAAPLVFKPSHYTRGKDGAPSDVMPPLTKETDRGDQESVLLTEMQVRRLTPLECERLQGFPDHYTQVPYGSSGKPAKDGPRYKVLGNSMATTVMQWIGRRIALVSSLENTY